MGDRGRISAYICRVVDSTIFSFCQPTVCPHWGEWAKTRASPYFFPPNELVTTVYFYELRKLYFSFTMNIIINSNLFILT